MTDMNSAMTHELHGAYYASCQKTFRKATNQPELMLRELEWITAPARDLRLLSVGAGTGLFELPMLELLVARGRVVRRFVGIDNDAYACQALHEKLEHAFGAVMDFDVFNQDFENFTSEERFDIVLLNHVFEYLRGDQARWLNATLSLLTEKGWVLVFSPLRGGINKIYEEQMRNIRGWPPFFADDIESLLTAEGLEFSAKTLMAECAITALAVPGKTKEKIKLLSFLTQSDCRTAPDQKIEEFCSYFMSLSNDERPSIPHPTTLFMIGAPPVILG